MYKRLTFLEAIKLRTYRLDQYSLRRQKLKTSGGRKQKKTGQPLPALTAIDLYGRDQAFRRSIVLPGKPLKEGGQFISYGSQGAQNYSSMFKTQSNAFSSSKAEAGISQECLPDEIPLEERTPQQFQLGRFSGNSKVKFDRENGVFIGPKNNVFENVPYIDCIAKGPPGRKWVSIELTCHRFSQVGGQSHYECLEQLGSFDPIPNRWGQKVCGLNVERIKYWLACGCHLTDASAKILGLAGITPISPDTVFQAKKLKERHVIEQRAAEWCRKNASDED